MKTFEKNLSRILKIGTLYCTYALICIVLLQIFARFFWTKAPSWTEEASRIAFIFAISFAAGLALKSKYYVAMDLFYHQFPKAVQQKVRWFISFTVMVFFGMVFFYALFFVRLGLHETSPSLGIPMAIPFLSILILSFSMTAFAALDLLKTRKMPV